MMLDTENSTIQILSERSLTKEQRQVLQLTVDGNNVNEICELLNMNRMKVELYLHTLLKKFNVDNKARLVRLALENGIVK